MFKRIAPVLVRRRRMVLALWGGFVIVAIVFGGRVVDRLAGTANGDRDVESFAVADRLDELGAGDPDVLILVDTRTGDASEPGSDVTSVGAEIEAAAADLAILPGVADVQSPSTPGAGPFLVATDQSAAVIAVSLDPDLDESGTDDAVDAVVERAEAIDAPRVIAGGDALLDRESVEQTERDLQRAELITLPIVLVLAVVIFGGLAAASLPLGLALVSIPGSLLVLLGLSHVTDLQVFALNAATMLGLGLAVDYALVVVSRFRDERALGHDVPTAVERTVVTAGSTVAFSGLTVAVALLGFVAFDNDVFRSIGLGGIGVVLLAMTAAVTLLPAVLAAFGHRIKPRRHVEGEGRGFARIAGFVQRRAALVLLGVTAVLVVLAQPFLGVRLEIPGADSLPPSLESRQLFDQLEERFLVGGDNPLVVVVEAPPAALGDYLPRVAALDGVAGTQLRPLPADVDGVTVIDVLPVGPAQGEVAESVVGQLRALDPGAPWQVGGPAAFLVDQRDSLFGRLPLALAIVATATFVLLFLLTGSVLIPIKALVMNVLSLTATFGVLVWGFQDGHLSGVLGFDSTGYLALWMPFLVFFLAFGLSMDYEVFLLARIKEEWDRTGDNDAAVASGLAHTGRVITSAAVLIGVVFGAFATGEAVETKVLGVGLSLAILVDATIVRTLLVPATMALLGRWNWWAPAPLRRVHAVLGLHEATLLDAAPSVTDELPATDGVPASSDEHAGEPVLV